MLFQSTRRLVAALMLALGALLTSVPAAHALDLDQARSQGLVGERYDGLIGPVQGGGEVEALVARINAQRMDEYRRIAQQNGVPIQAVQKMAGERLVNGAASGTFVMTPSGQWQRK